MGMERHVSLYSDIIISIFNHRCARCVRSFIVVEKWSESEKRVQKKEKEKTRIVLNNKRYEGGKRERERERAKGESTNERRRPFSLIIVFIYFAVCFHTLHT